MNDESDYKNAFGGIEAPLLCAFCGLCGGIFICLRDKMKSLFFLLLILMIGSHFALSSIPPLGSSSSPEIDFSNTPSNQNNVENDTPPAIIVIFGATGDLTARKLLPALYNLAHEGHLSENTAIVGFARGDLTDELFRKRMEEAVDQYSRNKPKNSQIWDHFEQKLFYHRSDYAQDKEYENLQKLLSIIDEELGTEGNRIYYLATPPSQFPVIIRKLSEHQLIYDSSSTNKKWSRVIIEKPFGNDLASALQLQKEISKYLHESQIYLMDHYLGKEGVQNLLTLRFENAIFEPLWNNKHIDHVQITLSEEIGIGSRAQFWEETGYLRDVFQNHLMQLLTIIAMEPPASLTASSIHEEKMKVLNAIRPFPLEELEKYVIRGQYGKGQINGISIPGYKEEQGVPPHSFVETFVAAKIYIDNPRWKGIPFYFRGGKRLPKQTSEIVITFKNDNPSIDSTLSNALFIRIQPKASLFLKTLTKIPMLQKKVQSVLFGYSSDSLKTSSPEAYEKLLYDGIRGDQSLFVRAEEQFAAWHLIAPILNGCKSQPEKVQNYEAGTWGPSSADQLLKENGHQWQLLDAVF